VENWDFNTQLERIQVAGKYLSSHNTKFGVSFEDTSRTSPEELTLVIEAALEAGAQRLAICDTVGDCTPEGAMKLTQFFLKFIKKSAVKVIWHGHNDKGLGMANAIAAAHSPGAISTHDAYKYMEIVLNYTKLTFFLNNTEVPIPELFQYLSLSCFMKWHLNN
jgi:hypothetical protein